MPFTYDTQDANPIVEAGIYEAVIMHCASDSTKRGDPKLLVTVKIYNSGGPQPLVYDHIMAPYGIRRLKSLCEACGVDFNSGSVNPQDFVGKNVMVRLKINHDESGDYEDANAVVDYRPDAQIDEDEGSAFRKFENEAKTQHPLVEDDRLRSEWTRIAGELFDKPRDKFLPEDWARLAKEGPALVVPF